MGLMGSLYGGAVSKIFQKKKKLCLSVHASGTPFFTSIIHDMAMPPLPLLPQLHLATWTVPHPNFLQ